MPQENSDKTKTSFTEIFTEKFHFNCCGYFHHILTMLYSQ